MPSHRWASVLATVGALLVAAFVALAVLIAAPPSVANLSSSISDGVEPVELATTGAKAAVVVPEGWIVVHQGDAEIVVRTPDAAMKVLIDLTGGTAASLVDAAEGRAGELRSETLASDLEVVHVDLEGGGIAAGVEVPGGVVGLRSEVLGDVDPAAYRPAFAQLLDGVLP